MELKPFQLGDFAIANPVLLAPMAGVSDAPFREICSAHGAGLTVAEMLTSNRERWVSDKNRLRQVKPRISGPQIIQIAGSDPALMAEAAIVNVAMGADVIDINMGCPAKKVLRKAAGSALLKDPALVARILRAVVAAVDVPVTLKIRTGWCPQSRNGIDIARLAEQCGVHMLTVHGRTRACRFRGQAEYDTIARIKQAVSIPVIANGDITSPEKARHVLEQTGTDGLMIGRAAQGQPWLFRGIQHFLATGRTLATPSLECIGDCMHRHLTKIYTFYGDRKGILYARKHVSWYARHLPEAVGYYQASCSGADGQVTSSSREGQSSEPDSCPKAFWRRFSQQATPTAQLATLADYFDVLQNNSNNKGEVAA